MKIALIVHDLHEHGGHSLYTRILAEELSRKHEVAVFANRCERPADADWKFYQVRAWRGSALATVQTFPIGLRTYSQQLSEFDIRHAQGYCGGDPNVVTAHICVAAYLDSLREISGRNRASLKLMAAAEERFYRRYNGPVIAISRKIADELRERYCVRGPITIAPHGVDAKRFDQEGRGVARSEVRAELGLDEARLAALYVGDLTKAHSYLKALASRTPEVEFVIVTGSTRYVWQAPNVRFLAPTNQLQRYYAAADAFVFPTTYDAFGMVVLEAMASALPVFCSDQAGAAELIESGRDGFVFPLKDWVEATATALSERAKLETIGHAAEKTAQRHDWPSVVRAVENVYLQTVADAGPSLAELRTDEYSYPR